MAVDYNRQYIGARYVPKFFENPDGSWDWAPGFQYEALTIVRYGENSYTSKKLVPSNIGAPNVENQYWANTGNYNGFVNKIESSLLHLKKPNVLVIGDSYLASGDGNYGDRFINNARLIKNSNAFLYGQGGAGFYNDGFLSLLNNAKSQIDMSSIDVIMVCGGANDLGRDNSYLRNGLTKFFSHVPAGIKVKLVFMALHKDYNSYDVKLLWEQYALINNAIYYDLQPIYHDYSQVTDTTHPTQYIQERFGWYVAGIYNDNLSIPTQKYFSTLKLAFTFASATNKMTIGWEGNGAGYSFIMTGTIENTPRIPAHTLTKFGYIEGSILLNYGQDIGLFPFYAIDSSSNLINSELFITIGATGGIDIRSFAEIPANSTLYFYKHNNFNVWNDDVNK